MSGRLSGQVAVVTGSTKGLGNAIARLYGSEGAKVVVASRSADAVTAAVADLRDAGVEAVGTACDVASLDEVRALRDLALDTYGRLDIWVNNAGASGVYGPTVDVPPELFERVVSTVVLGTYHGTITALDTMVRQGSGHLVNLMGRGDKYPVPFQTAYGASKSWVRAFTLGVAKENASTGVHVHALNPGLVQTDMLSEVDALPGSEEQLKRLPVITTMWGLTPERAALPALDLVLGTKVEHQSLGFPQILTRTLAYQAKKLLGRAPALAPMTVRTVERQR